MTRTQSLFAFFAVGIVAALTGALVARNVIQNRSPSPTLVSGTILMPARATPAFSLVDHNNAPFDATRLRGRWTLMFFGFTNCGDVCPTTLTLLGGVAKSLDDLPPERRPQVVFVSVDAKRDSSEVIKQYLRHFDPDFVGVTGSQSNLDSFTAALGVPSSIRELESGYAVDHSASILSFSPRGEFQALFSPPHSAEALVKDYRALIEAIR